jgi:uncharacterized membrane protein YfcA
MKPALFVALGICSVAFLAVWISTVRAQPPQSENRASPSLAQVLIGFFSDFFDTLGIGSFATTSAALKLKNLVPDEMLPGTLNIGHCIPTIVQAFIFIAIVEVEPVTLVSMIVASVLGAWFGAGVVSGLPRRKIQVGLGCALLVAAVLMLGTVLHCLPGGGSESGLHGARLWMAVGGNFVLGALMTLGIGLYAPCMILVSLLGMDPHAAFPIMMGSCAFLMPVGSLQFIRTQRYSLSTALGLTIGGIPAVAVAAFIVKKLPLDTVRWLVIAVVIYTSTMLLRSASARLGTEGEGNP